MKAHIKAAWIKAMLERTDTPARGVLRAGDQFCWQGLLCNVIDPTGWNAIGQYHFPNGGVTGCSIPADVSEAIGLPNKIRAKGQRYNDCPPGRSWSDLADWTRRYVPETP
jgi:hypothetical protein